jgi:hypothetical protein
MAPGRSASADPGEPSLRVNVGRPRGQLRGAEAERFVTRLRGRIDGAGAVHAADPAMYADKAPGRQS